MNKYKIIGYITISLIVLISLIYFLIPGEKQVLHIGYQPLTVNLPLFIAVENGFFEKEGIEIELIKYETTNQITDALLSDKIDMTGIIALYPLLSIQAQEEDLFKIYAVNQQNEKEHIDSLIVKKNSNIKGFEDLKGKKIGIFLGSSTKAITEVILSKFYKPDEATIIELSTPTQITALESGSVDALLTLEPTITIATSTGIAKIIEESPMSKYIVDDFTLGAAVISQKFLLENPETAEKIIYIFNQAIEKMNSDSSQRDILTKYMPVDKEVASKVGIGNIIGINEANIQAIQILSDIYYEKNLLPKKVKISEMIMK